MQNYILKIIIFKKFNPINTKEYITNENKNIIDNRVLQNANFKCSKNIWKTQVPIKIFDLEKLFYM